MAAVSTVRLVVMWMLVERTLNVLVHRRAFRQGLRAFATKPMYLVMRMQDAPPVWKGNGALVLAKQS